MSLRYPLIIATALVCLYHAVANGATAAVCVAATPELQQMDEGIVRIRSTDAPSAGLTVKIADDGFERAAGFQHVCPETVEHTAILFRFDADTRNPFHMRNCHAPLDIAFIDATGAVVDIRRMEPHVESVLFVRQPLYQSRMPFRYALETAAGRMKQLGIEVGTRLTIP